MLPFMPAHSVHPLSSPLTCDSTAVYYRSTLIAATENANTLLSSMRLLRRPSNRMVDDAAVIGRPANKPKFVTFDSTFTVATTWQFGPQRPEHIREFQASPA